MAALTIREVKFDGTAPAYEAASTSDTIDMSTSGPGTRTFVWYKNTNAATREIDVLIPTGHTPYTEEVQAKVGYTISATTGELAIPIHPDYIDAATGLVTITVSASAGVTVAAIRANWDMG